MTIEKFRWVAGVIASHSESEVHGRTRLQKEIKLLQRLGLPTDYSYKIHFYGPYSEGLQADIGVMEMLGLVTETTQDAGDEVRYVFKASESAGLTEVDQFKPMIGHFEEASSTVLELAATYDAFREQGSGHGLAMERLRNKKGVKCDGNRDQEALTLLEKIGLPFA